MKRLMMVLSVVAVLMFSVSTVMAQIDYCEGNFDYDRDQDGTDAFTFKADFGRSGISNPCPIDGPAPISRTGQTMCFDSTGMPRDCVGTGEDGEYLSGVIWPNPRFTDHGDGTVTDNLTGLMWTKDTQQIPGAMTWQAALDACNSLDYAGHDDWRLPNVRELESIVDHGRINPSLPEGHPFMNLGSWYWSSTSLRAIDPQYAWVVDINYYQLLAGYKPAVEYVWPVRGGRLLTF